MTESAVLRSERDAILEIVFNRPVKLNAINQEILDALRVAVEDLRMRDDLRVLLIRANGRYFSAGADLTAFDDNPAGRNGAKTRSWFRRGMGGMQLLWQEMEQVEKPIVVAHQAMCVGAGLEMSLSCDFRLAATSAEYYFPEMKMGMVPASGGISRLTRLCGIHWAKWMVLGNQKIDAERALAIGLVHAIYPDDSFEAHVWAFCRELASYPPEAMAVAKMSVEMAHDLDSANARQLERLVYSNLTAGEEQEALRQRHYQRVLKS